jgi:hypothetical protein
MRKELIPTTRDISDEVDRLTEKGLLSVGYSDTDLERCAELTWKINRLKREQVEGTNDEQPYARKFLAKPPYRHFGQ